VRLAAVAAGAAALPLGCHAKASEPSRRMKAAIRVWKRSISLNASSRSEPSGNRCAASHSLACKFTISFSFKTVWLLKVVSSYVRTYFYGEKYDRAANVVARKSFSRDRKRGASGS